MSELETALAHITEIRDDDEAAHNKQDTMLRQVLEAIARDEHPDADAWELAAVALRVYDIDFARWCA